MIDHSKSIEELENNYWPSLAIYPTSLVQKCYELRKIPIGSLTVENLRMLIGQNIGLQYLIPKILYILSETPFAEGDFYEGDLLINTLRSDLKYWENNSNNVSILLNIIKNVEMTISVLDTTEEVKSKILDASAKFKNWASDITHSAQ